MKLAILFTVSLTLFSCANTSVKSTDRQPNQIGDIGGKGIQVDPVDFIKMIQKRYKAINGKSPDTLKIEKIVLAHEETQKSIYFVDILLNGVTSQTYQIRIDQNSANDLSDIINTAYSNSQIDIAKHYNVNLEQLALFTEEAVDHVIENTKKDILKNEKITGIYCDLIGENYSKKAIILDVQIAYKKAVVPLLRRAYVARTGKLLEISYGE